MWDMKSLDLRGPAFRETRIQQRIAGEYIAGEKGTSHPSTFFS